MMVAAGRVMTNGRGGVISVQQLALSFISENAASRVGLRARGDRERVSVPAGLPRSSAVAVVQRLRHHERRTRGLPRLRQCVTSGVLDW